MICTIWLLIKVFGPDWLSLLGNPSVVVGVGTLYNIHVGSNKTKQYNLSAQSSKLPSPYSSGNKTKSHPSTRRRAPLLV